MRDNTVILLPRLPMIQLRLLTIFEKVTYAARLSVSKAIAQHKKSRFLIHLQPTYVLNHTGAIATAYHISP